MKYRYFGLAASLILLAACQPQSNVKPKPSYFTADNVVRLVNDDILKAEGLDSSGKEYQFKVGQTDLNQDGHDELLVLMQDPYFCGSGGCTAYLISYQGEVITKMSVVQEPILLANRQSHGWKDFYVWSNNSLRRMSYNGDSYPINPSIEPKYNREKELSTATKFIQVQEFYVQGGYDLVHVEDVPIFYPAQTYLFRFRNHDQPGLSYTAVVDMITGQFDVQSVASTP